MQMFAVQNKPGTHDQPFCTKLRLYRCYQVYGLSARTASGAMKSAAHSISPLLLPALSRRSSGNIV